MDDHKFLGVTGAYAISHSGQNFTGSCSCGWKRTRGGSHQNYHVLLEESWKDHVKRAEMKEASGSE